MHLSALFVFFCLFHVSYSGMILHISDIHLDLEYHEGGAANCWFPDLGCCHPTTLPYGKYKPAGRFSTRHCSSSYLLMKSSLESIKKYAIIHPEFTPTLIMYTGDSVGNHVTYLNPGMSMYYTELVAQTFKEIFPNTTIIYTPGNHDTWPINQWWKYNSWIVNSWYNSWKDSIPEDQIDTFKTGAYYAISPEPNLMIISINILWGEYKSFILNEEDAIVMYNWVNNTLSNCRQNNIKVYLVYHFGLCASEMRSSMSDHLRQIFSAYKDIIIASFSGHTHHEEFNIYTSSSSASEYIHMNYMVQSLKPDHSPAGFRMYSYDDLTHEITNIYSFSENEQETEKTNIFTLSQPLSYRDLFDLTSFDTKSFSHLLFSLKTNETLRTRFNSLYTKIPNKKCDEVCVHKFESTMVC
ncbi:hypothetical protein WA158_001303 [Blastocystis sp. Blastoise]